MQLAYLWVPALRKPSAIDAFRHCDRCQEFDWPLAVNTVAVTVDAAVAAAVGAMMPAKREARRPEKDKNGPLFV